MNFFASDFSAILSSDQLDTLRGLKINTSLEFVQCNNDRLATALGCKVSDIVKCKTKLLNFNNVKALSGDKLSQRLLENSSVSTGIPELVKCYCIQV